MVEAMRCGLACVAPDIPTGIHWTLSQGGGWLYQARSPEAAAKALVEATRNRELLLHKRREALRLSAELFSPSLVEEQYLQLEAALLKLTFNGQVLNPATAAKFRLVQLSDYGARFGYALEKIAHNPGWIFSKLMGKR